MRIHLSISIAAASLAAAMTSTGYPGQGFIGYGIQMYQPTCAFACHDSLSRYQLGCSVPMDPENMGDQNLGDTSMPKYITPANCYATDDNFLQSVAYCISTHCHGTPLSDLESYWTTYLLGRIPGQPTPKESYSTALAHADPPPTHPVPPTSILNTTTLVSEQAYMAIYNAQSYFEQMEIRQVDFGLVLLITGIAIPIACSLLRFVPFPSALASRFNAYFIDPPLVGRRHRKPLYNLALVPSRGQTLLIAYFIILNIVLSSVDYRLVWPNAYYGMPKDQLLVYIANRQGLLSFANLALLVLYSSRNNVLLWITNWSQATFFLLHRWIAIICTVEACIHSAVYLHIYLGFNEHASESKEAYWIWGIVATLAMSIMLPASILPLRQKLYNFFLASHFVLAFVAMIGCLYHIYRRYDRQWGYETWIYITFAFWAFDRGARLVRLVANGTRTAEITAIDEDYIRVNIPGVVAHGHAYLYFKLPGWRALQLWENHPFSITGSIINDTQHAIYSVAGGEQGTTLTISVPDKESSEHVSVASELLRFSAQEQSAASFKPGLTFFIRTSDRGFSSVLRAKSAVGVMVESSYPGLSLDELCTVPNCIVIAGGVGITGVGPLLRARGPGRMRFFWGVRSKRLVEAVVNALGVDVFTPNVVGEIAVGYRLNLREILEREVVGESETVVVVCGPVGMADEVREVVCDLGKKGRNVKLVDEAYSW
ncbi:ferric reductase like transmembrane component-domain-containing protein [Hypoxylon sp. FL1150]|nr:ferric reductase like transmembrane component-domain-containing protein [Hypoxylon sp. FL1150]